MNYGEVLRRALTITWRNPYLWLLALLAGEGGAFNIWNSQRGGPRQGAHAGAGQRPDMSQVGAWMSAHSGLLVSAAIVLLATCIVLFLVSVIAQGAVVRAVAEHDDERPYGLGAGWGAGLKTFWPLLRLKLLALAAFAVMFLVLGSLALAGFAGVSGGNLGLGFAAAGVAVAGAIIAVPGWIILRVLLVLASRAIVLDGLGVRPALRSAYELMRRRLGRVALVWILVGVAGVVGGFGVGLGSLAVGLPLALVTAGTYFAAGLTPAIAAGAILAAVWLIATLTLAGAVAAYQSTVWTLSYRRFDSEPQPVASAQPLPA